MRGAAGPCCTPARIRYGMDRTRAIEGNGTGLSLLGGGMSICALVCACALVCMHPLAGMHHAREKSCGCVHLLHTASCRCTWGVYTPEACVCVHVCVCVCECPRVHARVAPTSTCCARPRPAAVLPLPPGGRARSIPASR